MIKTITLIFLMLTTIIASAETGIASWYGDKHYGRRAASGEIYNMYNLTAAHKTLPFGSKIEVTNLENNKSVVLKVNDRGPFIRGRIVDISKKANQIIGCDLCKVTVKVLSRGDGIYKKE